MQGRLFSAIKYDNNPNDKVYTPVDIAKYIINTFQPTGLILDPCRGGGAFYDNLPSPKDWCEIDEGRDFYDYQNKVDWIISNPPFSDFNKWLYHSFEISENVVYVVPMGKIFKSIGVVNLIYEYGGMKECLLSSGREFGFPFGFPVGVVYFKKNYRGATQFGFLKQCDSKQGCLLGGGK